MFTLARMRRDEGGQIAVLVAVVALVLLLGVAAIAAMGVAVIERQAAVTAADATALGAARGSGEAVAAWYGHRGIEAQVGTDDARVTAGAASAHSRAEAETSLAVAPALIAVVERAGQLIGRPIEPAGQRDIVVSFEGADAEAFATIARDLRMCPIVSDLPGTSWMLC